MLQNVFIIGATGKVGSRLVSQIFEKGDTDRLKHINPTRIVGLASKSSFIYSAEGINEKNARLFSAKKEGRGYRGAAALFGVIRKSSENISVVDVTASGGMLSLHKRIIEETRHRIVTANKVPLTSCDFNTFQKLASETRRYGFRCSVMAGAEAIDKLRDLRDLGDPPTSITGCFSGTLGFITTGLEKGSRLSEMMAKAVELGYTEPNPANDLDGSDVARKILILARTAGFRVDLKDVLITPFIPAQYLSESDPRVFFRSLERLDSKFEKKMDNLLKKGKTLRYVADMKLTRRRPLISVGLRSVDLESPLGQLKGTANKIVIRTKTYGDAYYSVEAPGAGVEITAQNIRRDLLYQLDNRKLTQKG